MLEELKKVLAGIRRDTQRLLDNTLKSYLQIARYDVTTAPNGTVIGVTRPFSDTEIQIPYLPYCANATVGDTVLVVWWGSLTNAQAWFKLPAEPGILNFRPGGTGAAFGKSAESDNLLDSSWPIRSPNFQYIRENLSSFTFTNLPLIDSPYHFKYGLLFGGDNPGVLYMVFVGVDLSVTLTPILPYYSVTLSGAVSGTSLVITASGIVYGGLRLIWIN